MEEKQEEMEMKEIKNRKVIETRWRRKDGWVLSVRFISRIWK